MNLKKLLTCFQLMALLFMSTSLVKGVWFKIKTKDYTSMESSTNDISNEKLKDIIYADEDDDTSPRDGWIS